VIEVDADELVGVVVEDAFQVAFSGGLEGVVDLQGGGVLAQVHVEADEGDVGDGDADGGAVELAFELREDEAHGFRGAGAGGDGADGGGAGAVQVFV